MARYLFVGVLVLCFASPAFAAKRYYNRGASDQCKIVNIAALLQRDDDPEWQKGVRHPINRSGQHGHHLQTRGGLVIGMLCRPIELPATALA
jgi:hypothetical protein